jgi:hypothetical protein
MKIRAIERKPISPGAVVFSFGEFEECAGSEVPTAYLTGLAARGHL